MKFKKRDLICMILLLLSLVGALLLFFMKPAFLEDEDANKLIIEAATRGVLLVGILAIFFAYGYHRRWSIFTKEAWIHSLWILPLLLQVLVNFPWNAVLISKTANVERPDLLGLFSIFTLSIGILEEVLFRGIFLDFLISTFKKRKNGVFYAVLADASIFGLYHLVNLFAGGSFGGTLIQVGYSFLIGGMLAVALLRTKNILFPIILHFIFDFGGYFVNYLGHGLFQDEVFWILTICLGALTAGHVLMTLFNLNKEANKALGIEKQK